MKEQLTEAARKAREAATRAAKETKEFVQSHAPTDADIARVKLVASRMGKAAVESATELGREVAESKAVQDAAKGATVGAIVAVPLPVVGPVIGAVVGAGVGVYLGQKGGASGEAQLPGPPKDLHDELLKLDSLRQKGLLTDAEFEARKRKLLKST